MLMAMIGQMESELQGVRQALSVAEAERNACREQVHINRFCLQGLI